MVSLQIFYLTVAIALLALAIILYPTLKEQNKRKKK